MGWRGLGAVAALLAASVVVGFALAAALQSSPVTTGAPEPVVAVNPRFPVDPPTQLRDDPPQPALGRNLPLREVAVGTDNYKFVFLAPRGWSRLETSSNEVKYKKAQNPSNTYILRVEQVVSQHEQIPDILASRIVDLRRDEEQVKVIRRTYDTLEFSYVHDGYRRFSIITWLDVTRSGQAEAEIAVTGREVDVPGMRDLIDDVIFGRADARGIHAP
ncbi:hypothetical protein [Nocardioides currus]|uniref:Transcriptional regulator n=1 Tax=Nocardioides currus TaxID=2133958 RepID=A0A2R7YYF0_9ACTN|nr:hypothetical protein [Nocardioides currus]PUA81402.1 hypothetical protein C7S10_10345 [Nocardioides currus]